MTVNTDEVVSSYMTETEIAVHKRFLNLRRACAPILCHFPMMHDER